MAGNSGGGSHAFMVRMTLFDDFNHLVEVANQP